MGDEKWCLPFSSGSWFDPKPQWYAHPKGKHGRNQTYSDTAIQCCLMIKSLFRLSLRMVTGFVQSLIKLCGLNGIAPDYSTICRRQKHIDIQICYERSRNWLHLLVDSMGLKFLGVKVKWKRKKHQPEYRRQLRKLHNWFSLYRWGLWYKTMPSGHCRSASVYSDSTQKKIQSLGKIQRPAR